MLVTFCRCIFEQGNASCEEIAWWRGEF
uniref:Uncharacterized protein n=1 Tax=Arundo donax TaxID=35708 RepID=A0A0A9AJ87_ARUDO